MEFYQVSSDWLYSPVLNRIENKYGLAGIGFYWKVICAIHLAGSPTPEINLLSMRGRGLRWEEAAQILHETTAVFVHDELKRYILRRDTIATGLYHAKNAPYPCIYATGAGTEASTEAGTGASTEAGIGTGTEAGSAQVLVDKDRLDKIRDEIAAEASFENFLKDRCPHLLMMQEPISFDELKDLRRDFSIAEIRSVLLDMENKTNIETAFRSCAKTARHWLEHRKNR